MVKTTELTVDTLHIHFLVDSLFVQLYQSFWTVTVVKVLF